MAFPHTPLFLIQRTHLRRGPAGANLQFKNKNEIFFKKRILFLILIEKIIANSPV